MEIDRFARTAGALAATMIAGSATLAAAQTTSSTLLTTTTFVVTTTIVGGTTSTTLAPTTLQRCYKVSDTLKLRSDAPAWLRLVHDQLGTENCRIGGGSRFVCVPVTAEITAPIEGSFSGGAYLPLAMTPLGSEQAITQERLCYKVKCSDRPTINTQTVLYSDRFGTRQVSRFKASMVCGPAIRATCGNGVLDFGEQCDDGNNVDKDCCSALCTAEAAGKVLACVDNDGNACTEAACDGLGQCSQTHILPTSTKACADTDANVCTEARCDGAGSCNQMAVLQPATLACADTDANSCTGARCDGAGACAQQAIVQPNGAACAETDGNPCTRGLCAAGLCEQGNLVGAGTICADGDGNQCTTAACDGAGTCDQNFFVRNCTPPLVCNPGNGVCQ